MPLIVIQQTLAGIRLPAVVVRNAHICYKWLTMMYNNHRFIDKAVYENYLRQHRNSFQIITVLKKTSYLPRTPWLTISMLCTKACLDSGTIQKVEKHHAPVFRSRLVFCFFWNSLSKRAHGSPHQLRICLRHAKQFFSALLRRFFTQHFSTEYACIRLITPRFSLAHQKHVWKALSRASWNASWTYSMGCRIITSLATVTFCPLLQCLLARILLTSWPSFAILYVLIIAMQVINAATPWHIINPNC